MRKTIKSFTLIFIITLFLAGCASLKSEQKPVKTVSTTTSTVSDSTTTFIVSDDSTTTQLSSTYNGSVKVTLKAANNNAPSQKQLDEARIILTDRLESFGILNARFTANADTIEVNIPLKKTKV
jgi:uncharacterized lipoprotein YajG